MRGQLVTDKAVLVPCLYTGGCARRTSDPSRLCHRHRHLQTGYTPGRQLVFGGGGPLGLLPKLEKEHSVAPPVGDDSMEIDGFPYYAVSDHKAYIDWRLGRGPRPSTEAILDRFPIQVAEATGSAITGAEIGVYDSAGRLAAFDHTAVPQEATGTTGEVRFLPTEGGAEIAIRSSDVYLIVIFDRDRLGSHLP